MNKSHKLSFGQSTLLSRRPLDLVYSDVWGPSPVDSINKFIYYVIFVDHFTKYTWLYPISLKSDTMHTFTTFKSLVENYFNTKLATLYSDMGGEYQKLQKFLQSHGAQHLTTPPNTPQHNGSAECRHRHIVETGLTLLHQASIPLTYWPFAFQAATYLINCLPTPVLNNKSPFESLFHVAPNYRKLKVFGCLCYPWLWPYAKHKLESRSKRSVFLGYYTHQSAYKS